MKKIFLIALFAAAALALLVVQAQAASLYWDTNGATPGSGAGNGTWGTNTYWSTDPTGSIVTTGIAPPTNADDAFFSAGTNGGAGAVTVKAAYGAVANSLTFQNPVAVPIQALNSFNNGISYGSTLTLGNGTSTTAGIFTTAAVATSATAISQALTLNATTTTFQAGSTGVLTLSGGVLGTSNVTINNNSTTAAGIVFSTNQLNNTGSISNGGSGSGSVSITGGVGSNVTAITQNSNTSAITISTSGATGLRVNSGGTTLTQAGSGAALLTVSSQIRGTGDLIIKNNSNVANGVTISGAVNNVGLIRNEGTGTGTETLTNATANGLPAVGYNVTGITENSTTSALTISTGGLMVNPLGTTLTNANSSGSSLLTLSGGSTGIGDLILKNNSAIANGVTVSTTALNNAGLIRNEGTSSGSVSISAAIGNTANANNQINNITGVTQNSTSSSMTLSGANNYTAATTILAGTLKAGNARAFGYASAVTLANVAGATLDITGFDNAIGSLAGGGATGGNVILGTQNLTVGSDNTSTTFSGLFSGATAGKLIKLGSGTLTLNGATAHTYTGATTVNRGTLSLDFSNMGTPTNLLSSSSPLTMGGGALNLIGKSGTTTAQTFGATTTIGGNGYNNFTVTQNGATAVNVTLNALARSGASTVNFVLPTAGSVTTSSTTFKVGTNNILATAASGIAHSTVSGTTWATNTNGTIGALGNGNYTNSYTALLDTDVIGNDAPSAFTVNTLRFNTANKTLTLNSSGTSTVTSGGILVTATGAGSVIASGGGSAALTSAELVIHNYSDLTISAPITASALTFGGTGTTILTGANTGASSIRVGAGTLQVGNGATAGSVSTYAAIVLSDNNPDARINFNRSDSGGSFGNVISGAGSLAVNGGGTLTLSAANTYTGGTFIQNGALQLTRAAGAGLASTSTVTLGSGANSGKLILGNATNISNLILAGITTSGAGTANAIVGGNAAASTLTINNDFINGIRQDSTYSGVIGGAGTNENNIALTKSGYGTLTLTGNNTYTGATTVNAGVLNIQHGNALGSTAAGTTVANLATLQIQGGITVGSEALNFLGAGAGGQTGALVNVGGVNNYGGQLTINSAATAGVTISSDSGTLNLTNTGAFTSAVAAPSAATNAVTLAGIGNGSISGGIQTGLGNFIKNGPGTWTLYGNNTFTGATTVNGGKLVIDISGNSNTGAYSASSAITLVGGAITLKAKSAGDSSLTLGTVTASNAAMGLNVLAIDQGSNTTAAILTLGTFIANNTPVISLLDLSLAPNWTVKSTAAINGFTTTSGAVLKTSDGIYGWVTNGNVAGATITKATETALTAAGSTAATSISSANSNLNLSLNSGGISGGALDINTTGAGNDTSKLTLNATAGSVFGVAHLLMQGDRDFTIGGGSGSKLGAGTGQANLIINHYGTGTLTLSPESYGYDGSSRFNLAGTGKIVLKGVATFEGGGSFPIWISGATVSIGADNNLPILNSPVALAGGTLQATDTFEIARDIGITGNGGTIDVANTKTLTASGIVGGQFLGTTVAAANIAGAGLTKTGDGTLVLTGANLYNGATTLTGGNLSVSRIGNGGVAGNIGVANNAASNLVFNGGSLLYTGANATTNRAFTINNGKTAGINVSNATTTLVLNGSDSGSIGVSSNGSLLKSGAGTLTLNGTYTYTGGTTVSEGTLTIGASDRLADTGNLTVSGSGTFNLGASKNETVNVVNVSATSGGISGTGTSTLNATGGYLITNASGSNTISAILAGTTLTKSGAGTSILSANNTYTGATTVSEGTLAIGASERILNTGNLTVSGSGTFDLGNNQNETLNVVTVNATSGGISGTGTSTLNATGGYLITNASGSNTISAILAGTTLTKSGAGTSILSANNTYTGATTVSEGTLAINSVSALGSTSGINLANATTLIYNGSAATLDRAISVTGGTGTLRNTGGALTLTGGLTKNGTTLTLDSGTLNVNTVGISGSAANSDLVIDGATVNLNIANTYNGPTRIIDGGTLNANVTGALPTANGRTAISIDATGTGSSRLVLGASQSIASLSGAASSNVTLGSNTLTVGTSGGSTTFAGRITGIGGLVKDGAGTLVLNGSNTYAGGTTISAGNLTISGGAALADNGLVTLSNTSGAVLSVSTSETIGSLSGGGGSGGDIVIGSGQALTVNQTTATTYSGGISGTGGLVKSGSGNLTLSGTNTYTGNTTVNGGTLNAAAANAAGGTTVIDVNSGSFLVTAANAVNDNAAIKLNGGTLAVSGTFEETVGALTLSANSTIDLAGFTGTLRFSGVGSWANTANLAIWNWNGINQYGTPVGDGANNRHVVFANNSGLSNYLDRISFYSDSGSSFAGNGFEQGFSGGSSEIIAVPETETYFAGILLILGATIYQLRLARQGRGFLACLRSHLQKTHRTP